jgi:putative transposase
VGVQDVNNVTALACFDELDQCLKDDSCDERQHTFPSARQAEKKNFSPRHREANARKDDLHQLSTEIAKSHGIVKTDKLKVGNMTASAAGSVEEPGRNVKKSGLNRSILEAGKSLRGRRGRSPRRQAGGHCHAHRVMRTIEDLAGLWTWRDRVRREFKPVEWRRSAGAVLTGLDTTEDASNAAEPQLRRRA